MQIEASILIVEDQTDLRDNLRLTLETDGHRVLTAADGLEALQVLKAQPVNLILSDVVMPRMNGYQLYRQVRGEFQWITIPFIFLSVRHLDSDIRFGKALGVDDYLVKPIQPADLLATVRGTLRRAHQLVHHRTLNHSACAPSKLNTDPLTIGSLHIAIRQHRVWLAGRRINLSAREFRLLVHLAQRAGQVVSLNELIQVTHQRSVEKSKAGILVRPVLRSLRRKLGYPAGASGCIKNLRGLGYRLIPPHS